MNVGDYAETIIQLNPGIKEDYAYDLAYEEFANYSKFFFKLLNFGIIRFF